MERAKNETIDSLYKHAKQITEDYNDQKKEKVVLLAIDIIWSYFQDKFPTTHYDIVRCYIELISVIIQLQYYEITFNIVIRIKIIICFKYKNIINFI